MRKAIIDLGTNTFNLLIADVNGKDISILHAEKEGVALGMGGINDKRISIEAWERAFQTLSRYLEICHLLKVENIQAYGTSAVRDAENGNHFQETLKEELSLDLRIISGEEEADLIYRGVSALHSFEEEGVIVDIGGGSTEIIHADCTGVKHARSFDIGVSRIYQKFKLNDPLSKEDEKRIVSFLEEKVGNYFQDKSAGTLVGSSGSFETFYELIHQQHFPKASTIFEVEMSDFKRVLEEVKRSTLAEREKNEFIIPIRKIMAPITAVKTEWLLEKLQIEKLLISPYSLKEGALLR